MFPSSIGIVGPTGIGKSEVAIRIARKIPAEIISVDSMQVYRGMDLGTGKPSASVREEIPHHGLDLLGPEEEFNVGRYLAAVAPLVDQINQRGRLALLVGGTGLYLKRLLDGLCPAPGGSASVRKELFERAEAEGSWVLHAKLQEVDPASAVRIHPNDLKKTVRALEVYQLTRRPISDWHKATEPLLAGEGEVRLFGLTGAREFVYRRIEERVDRWLAQGWLEEAKRLQGVPLSRTARKALGYEELFSFLAGKTDWEATVGLIKQRSRQYAKRQWTWFKADPRVVWISVDGKTADEAAEEILRGLKPGALD
ncbi:MAG: tRNA (adenosine(37)-N6)-dimethylallyltransferase MiaA [Candidatus Omnitrophica bacterium]|nr:tRNA (adenosine(37)-N6)-dimethylallyltransferase MiaA [Candidatus Omnitrophota bacterium]